MEKKLSASLRSFESVETTQTNTTVSKVTREVSKYLRSVKKTTHNTTERIILTCFFEQSWISVSCSWQTFVFQPQLLLHIVQTEHLEHLWWKKDTVLLASKNKSVWMSKMQLVRQQQGPNKAESLINTRHKENYTKARLQYDCVCFN